MCTCQFILACAETKQYKNTKKTLLQRINVTVTYAVECWYKLQYMTDIASTKGSRNQSFSC